MIKLIFNTFQREQELKLYFYPVKFFQISVAKILMPAKG